MTFPLSDSAARALTAVTLLGLATIASPGVARAVDLFPGAAGGSPLVLAQYSAAPTAMTTKPSTASAKLAPADRTEARIKDLHDKLHITAAQSAQWETVAQAMRLSGTSMSESITERSASTKSMTAMDDLRSYQRVAQAHTDGLNKFVPAFGALYEGMSVEQKKNADMVFAKSQRHPAPQNKTTSKIN